MNPRLEFSTNQLNSSDEYRIQHGPQDMLHMAAQYNDVEIIKQILAFDPAALNRPHSMHGTTPICWSVEFFSHDATFELLNAGAELMPVYAPYEQYFPLSFLTDDMNSYTPVEHEVYNRTSRIVEFHLNRFRELSPALLFTIMQGNIALGRKFKEDYGRYNCLMNLYNHMMQMVFDLELKHNYLMCSMLGIRSLSDAYDFPPSNSEAGYIARQASMNVLKNLVGIIPGNYTNPALSYAIFAYVREKVSAGISDYEFLFDCAIDCSPNSDKFFIAALVLNYCSYIINIDIDDDEPDTTLDRVTALIYPAITDIANISFKNHSLARLFVSLATSILELLDDSENLAISLLSEAVRLDNDINDINLYFRAILLLRADRFLLDDEKDLLDAIFILDQINYLPSPVINDPGSDYYSSYLTAISDKSLAIINMIFSEISELIEQNSNEDIISKMPAHFSMIEQCLKLLLAHISHESTITLKISKVFFTINKLLSSDKWNFSEASNEFHIATIITDFMRRMADLTQFDYVRLYHADFLFTHLEYHESLENYIKLAQSYLYKNKSEDFHKVIQKIIEIESYFDDKPVVYLLIHLIAFSHLWIPINTPQLFFHLMRQALTMNQDKWLSELYFTLAEETYQAICASEIAAPLLVHGFYFPDINDKNAFIAGFNELKYEASRLQQSHSAIFHDNLPTFFSSSRPSVAGCTDEKMQTDRVPVEMVFRQ